MRDGYQKIFLTAFCVIFVCLYLLPVYWMFNISIRPTTEIITRDTVLWPKSITFGHYVNLFFPKYGESFLVYIQNSLLVSVFVTTMSIAISSFAAYAVIRLKFRGSRLISNSILITYTLPEVLLTIPLYLILHSMSLTNSLLGLSIVQLTFTVPFCMWVLMGFFESFPRAIEDAAMIDGASRVQTIIRIVLPLTAPGIIVAATFSFVKSWNDYLWAMTFITSEYKKTVVLGLMDFIVGDVIQWGKIMAGATVISIPSIVLFLLLEKYLVQGLLRGAVKG